MPNDYNFSYTQPKLGLWVTGRNLFAGIRDRKGVLSQFLKENNIHPNDVSGHALTRVTYMIRTHHVEYLAHLRDQVIIHELVKIHKRQKAVRDQIDWIEAVLAKEQDKLADLKSQLADVKLLLKESNLTSLDKAYHQGNRGTLEASVANQLQEVTRVMNQEANLKDTLKDNLKMFEKFIADVCGKYDNALNEYVKLSGRLLHHMGFTNYNAELRDFSNDIKKQDERLKHGI